MPSLDPLVLLSYAAAVTSRARLGISVLVFPLHNPVSVARQVGSLDVASGGRAVLGIGSKSAPYAAFGLPSDRRVQRFLEGVEVMTALWIEKRAQFNGEFYRLDGAPMEPKPVHKPHPPIWMGGSHPNVLKRAVQVANGWMGAGGSSLDEFMKLASQLREILERSGRDRSTFTVSKRIYLAVDSDSARARRKLREAYHALYGNPDAADRQCLWGSPAECAERLEALVSTGVDHLLLHPVYDLEEQLEAVAAVVGLASSERSSGSTAVSQPANRTGRR